MVCSWRGQLWVHFLSHPLQYVTMASEMPLPILLLSHVPRPELLSPLETGLRHCLLSWFKALFHPLSPFQWKQSKVHPEGGLKREGKTNKENLCICVSFSQCVSSQMCWSSSLPPVSELRGLMKLTFLPLQCYVTLKTFSTSNRYVG